MSKSCSKEYNRVLPIDLDSIPVEKREEALLEFSEGSIGLEHCLRTMWDNGLKTHACCAGHDKINNRAYIAMSPNVDVFSYLSCDLIDNDMVDLIDSFGKQIIRFNGTKEQTENLFFQLAGDIVQGKKCNNESVREKINKFVFNSQALYNSYILSQNETLQDDNEFVSNDSLESNKRK